MLLYEEYIKRHSLNVASTRYVEKGSFLVKSIRKEGSLTSKDYLLFSIVWQFRPRGEPGKFAVSIFRPKHNGCDSNLFNTVGEDNIQWDEYEKYLFDLLKITPRRDLLLDGKQIELAFWNIFLYCCDTLIAEKGYYQRFFPTVDSDLSLTDRYLAFRNALRFLERHDTRCWDIWKSNMADRITNYCHWVGDLVDPSLLSVKI